MNKSEKNKQFKKILTKQMNINRFLDVLNDFKKNSQQNKKMEEKELELKEMRLEDLEKEELSKKNEEIKIEELKENKYDLESTLLTKKEEYEKMNEDELFLKIEKMEEINDNSSDELDELMNNENEKKIILPERKSMQDMSEEIVIQIDKYVKLKQRSLDDYVSDTTDSDDSPIILPLKEIKFDDLENEIKGKNEKINKTDKKSEPPKKKGIMRKSSLDSNKNDDREISSSAQEELNKLFQHNKKIEIIMKMEEDEIENLHVFVHKLNLVNKMKVVSEEVKKK